MLLMRLRERPCNAFTARVSVVRSNRTSLPSRRSLICCGKVHSNLPFGPSTVTAPESVHPSFTLSGSNTLFFPIRDILYSSLPNNRQEFASDIFSFSLPARQDPSRRGND